jgi:hypothetical protein
VPFCPASGRAVALPVQHVSPLSMLGG